MNILTFDIEEWYHFDIFSTQEKWDNYEPRIDLYLPKVLDKLDEKHIKATFFCLGWIARKYPHILMKIMERGHEIGCHTDKHFFVKDMTPESFNEDLQLALDSIENVTGKKVLSFRAPAFTITEDSIWAFEVLAKHGILNDSSIFPAKRSYGGFASFGEAKPSLIFYKDYTVKEFPMNTGSILGKDFVFCGGGYFRLFPLAMIRKLMCQSDYNITYLHMRDFDYEQIRFKYFSMMRYFKSYYGLKNTFYKFEEIINDFSWVNIEKAAEMIDWDKARRVVL